MSVPNSVEELLQLVRKSTMIEDAKLNGYLCRRQAGRGLPADPREAAEAMVADGLLTNFQAEQFLLGKWRGFTVGKFKLLERVGVGGMGQVFLCEHMFMKRRVAVKVLPPQKAEQPAALGRFYREARAAGGLDHPNIVRTHDIDQDGNLHFIVMEYVDGTNLLDLVKRFGPMDIRRATHYIRQTALGLDYAYKSGIIHRDIKPGNVLINRLGQAKLLDMGLARFYHDQSDMLTVKYDDKIVLGTADYVAPEQVANSHSVDVRADIYALGGSLYFLLAGHPPFPTGTVSQKLLWHRTKDPTPIRQIRPEVPEGLAAIVAKMLHKDPNQRYQTPGEVIAELERWVPASIPVPSVEEMPVLSPAALEAAEADAALAQPASVSMSKLRSEMATAGVSSKPGPYGSAKHEAHRSEAPLSLSSSGESVAVLTKSRSMASMPSPFGSSGNTVTPNPTSAMQPTLPNPPSPAMAGGLLKTTSFTAVPDQPGTFPLIAMPPQDPTGKNRTNLVVALIGLALVISVGLFLYKFVISKPKVGEPEPVQQTG